MASESSQFTAAVQERLAAVVAASTAKDGESSAESPKLGSVKELILDGKTLPKTLSVADKEYLSQFTALEKLTCNQTGLQQLGNFPPLASLKTLELADNHLAAEEISHLPTICPAVKRLILGGSKLKAVKQLDPLKQLKSLQHLDLELTPLAAETSTYRDSVFEQLPSLVTLDGRNRQNEEVEDSEGNDEDDDEEEGEEEEEGDGEDTTLKDFYTKDYVEAGEGNGEDEDEDDEAFAPPGEDDEEDLSDDDDDEEEEEEEEEDDDEEEEEEEGADEEEEEDEEMTADGDDSAAVSPGVKRKLDSSSVANGNAGDEKKSKAEA